MAFKTIFRHKFTITIGLICLAFLVLPLVRSSVVSATETVCSGGSCYIVECSKNSDCSINGFTKNSYCRGNDLYQDYAAYTCSNPGSQNSNCIGSITPKLVQTCTEKCEVGHFYIGCRSTIGSGNTNQPPPPIPPPQGCFPYASQRCIENSLYWFDSCGNQQGFYRTCAANQTCSVNKCVTDTPYITNYTKGCFNNNVYWYDSLGNEQGIYQNCSATGQTCQDGQCIGEKTSPAYVKHAQKRCHQNDLYWFDSKGNVQDLYKSCADNNACTIDSCQDNQCQNVLKCDGSSCSVESDDYVTYCASLGCVLPNQTQAQGPVSPTPLQPDQTLDQIVKAETTLTAAASQNPSVLNLLKKWYVWLIIIAVLVLLFTVIFRKLSSSV